MTSVIISQILLKSGHSLAFCCSFFSSVFMSKAYERMGHPIVFGGKPLKDFTVEVLMPNQWLKICPSFRTAGGSIFT